MEAIRMLIIVASYMGFKPYQMDVKSAFLNEYLKEVVFVCQPPSIESHEFSDHVYKLDKCKDNLYSYCNSDRLDMDEPGLPVDEKKYISMIGFLLYLTQSRPDIIYSVGLCTRFQSSPKESYLKVMKRILRYAKGTQDQVLWYPSGDMFDLIRYEDVDYTSYLMDRKSLSGMTHFLGSCLISWKVDLVSDDEEKEDEEKEDEEEEREDEVPLHRKIKEEDGSFSTTPKKKNIP
ncbi:uncharacterized protein LOC142170459 [Nicotiana tabacum]|uniref:Uncharacterized protein LOC142170459 n=1 Tax=Nicotiana tabacum TaxID=4097 RepID=A0AC58SU34_TOBAC